MKLIRLATMLMHCILTVMYYLNSSDEKLVDLVTQYPYSSYIIAYQRMFYIDRPLDVLALN